METFNKNWLVIILIAIVFGAIGFLFGWILKPDYSHCNSNHQNKMHEKHQCNSTKHNCAAFNEGDSIQNVDVEVIVTDDGKTTTSTNNGEKKVVVKKIIQE